MNMRDYPTLHLVSTRVKEKEQLVVRKDMGVHEHEKLSNITRVKEKEQLVVRKDMGVNEHERLSNITLSQYTS